MTYYHPATLTERGRLPKGADANGQWIEPVTEDNAASCGWFPVVETQRPADTAQDTYVRTITLPGGVPTETWTARPWSVEELAAQAAQANEAAIGTYLTEALVTLQAIDDKPAAQFTQQGLRGVQDDLDTVIKVVKRLIRKVNRQLESQT